MNHKPTSLADDPAEIPGFRPVPRTGVIYVMHRATELGFTPDSDEWANLGQGAPECGPLPGAPPRVETLTTRPGELEYGPVGGSVELRERVAAFYNEIHRRGRSSQYTADNVCIAPGGRAAMTRVVASLGGLNLGHFIPDYTAYEELLSTFRGFVSIPILLDPAAGYRYEPAQLEAEIVGRGLGAVLASNPCNPTGQLVEGADLEGWVAVARECRCTLILDEFYSHFIYTGAGPDEAKMVSAAACIDDVERDPVIIVDGLTKNWRYPGWRVSWILGPSRVIDAVTSAGSFLDGGANHPYQRPAAALLDPGLARRETAATQRSFRAKRGVMIDRLRELGVRIDAEPAGAFYVWGDLSGLPAPLDDGFELFRRGLEEKVITVPGVFFDVNPGQRRRHAKYQSFTRFSFGPAMATLERGLDALGRVVNGGA